MQWCDNLAPLISDNEIKVVASLMMEREKLRTANACLINICESEGVI